LDACFTLRHLVDKTRFEGGLLWVVFVDFKKAFDSVRRDLLIERCQQIGVHGPFLDAICMLYDRVVLKVKVNGAFGDEFDTYLGTIQGSELSPLLFGLFMDLLHELIALEAPGAGPLVGSLRVPDIMYADDVGLISTNHSQAQDLLNCLDVFCHLFSMTVNMQPNKTCCVVFRSPGVQLQTNLPPLTYRGQIVAQADSYKYLGLQFHETAGLQVAADALACSGRKALHALLPRLRQHHISQFDLRCRMFDVLVEPVLSYGSQVWGPDMIQDWLLRPGGGWCHADQTHFMFLGITSSASKKCCRQTLLREFHRIPMLYRWLLLTASWWQKLAGMAASRLAYQAWSADISLMLAGCTDCWSYKFLCVLERLDVLSAVQWRPGSAGVSVTSVQGLAVTRAAVQTSLNDFHGRRLLTLLGQGVDPRAGGANQHLR
jgi:sorting nexin-29